MSLSHDEFQSLLAASALNALPSDEAELLEQHLEHCSGCRTELTEFQNTTSMLVEPEPDPPAGLWDEIVASIERQPEEMPQSLRRVVRKRSRWVQGWTLVATGAVAAVIILAISVANLNGDVTHLQNQAATSPLQRAVDNALAASHHQVVELRTPSGAGVARAVITTDGTAYLVPQTMSALGTGSTYQLWAESRGKAVSLGVLGPRPGIAAFRVEVGMTALMLTAEPTGGVPAPTSAILASAGVPTST
jgi:predicted anti-sigma-YlaC factor YlaD